ncbi:MAG: hypothetical protein WC842_04310 [Candidatus Paceibacterota bacterium]|jgi:hypothetical protein
MTRIQTKSGQPLVYNTTVPVLANEEEAAFECDVSGNLKVTLATTLDDVNDSITVYPKCSFANISASAQIKASAGQIYGVIVNSMSSGTLKLWDNTAGSGTILCNTITFAATDRFISLFGATFGTGLYATVGGTADLTILYR